MSTSILPKPEPQVNELFAPSYYRERDAMRWASQQIDDGQMTYACRDAKTLVVYSLPTAAAARWHEYKLSLGSDGDLYCSCAWCQQRRRQTGERCKHIHGAYRMARRLLGRAAPLLWDGATVIRAIRDGR